MSGGFLGLGLGLGCIGLGSGSWGKIDGWMGFVRSCSAKDAFACCRIRRVIVLVLVVLYWEAQIDRQIDRTRCRGREREGEVESEYLSLKNVPPFLSGLVITRSNTRAVTTNKY